MHKKHDLEAPRTIYGCSACKINLCNHARCWDEHLAAVKQKGWQELQTSRLGNQPSAEALNGMRDTFEYSSTVAEGEWPENTMIEEQWSDDGYEDDVGGDKDLGLSFASELARAPYYNSDFSTTTQ
jgi:hypothetical protein